MNLRHHNPIRAVGAGLARRLFPGALVLAACAGVVLTAPGAVAAAPAAAATVTTAAPGGCEISKLPVPEGTSRSDVTGGDPTGRYLIGDATVRVDGVSTLAALLWIDGRLSDFRAPYPGARLADVNASGAITGTTYNQTDGQFAWRYDRGQFSKLPGLEPGHSTSAVAINRQGDVLGSSLDAAQRAVPVIWPARQPGTVRPVRAAGQPATITPWDLDDDGTVLATTNMETYIVPPRGRAWKLTGPAGSTAVGATAIRNGWVAGYENVAPHSVPVRFQVRSRTATKVSDGLFFVYSVNRHGSISIQGFGHGQAAIAHRDGRIVALPNLGAGAAGAKYLSDAGLAAGFANDTTMVHAVVWRGC